ncbi:DUF2784 domain-containing protein [Mycobacterium sp.]|uniref:DUF2784 domain-containing protein n=1 Tax=Mycobacterium sp. TaxID=1785 RepID=UPI0031E2B29B
MKATYSALVAATVGAHFGYLAYLPSGGFLALRWPRTLWLHVPAVAWGVGVVVLHLPCPLTALESWARRRAGIGPLPPSGFVDRYVAGVCYPPGSTGSAQLLAFTAAAISWILLAAKRTRR